MESLSARMVILIFKDIRKFIYKLTSGTLTALALCFEFKQWKYFDYIRNEDHSI